MENTNSAINVANYFIEQGYTNRGNSILYYSSQYRLEKEEIDGSTSEVIFLGDYGNNIDKVSKSDTIEIVNKKNIELNNTSFQNFYQTLSSDSYTVQTTQYGNRYSNYDADAIFKKEYDDGTVETIYCKIKNHEIVGNIEITKTRKVAVDTYYNEIKSELTWNEPVDKDTYDENTNEYNANEDNTENILDLKNASSLTSSTSTSTVSGSKVSLNIEKILNKIKIVRNTYGYGNTEELIKVIKNNLELKNKSYKPKEMFDSVETYNYFSNQLDNYLDRIENVVLQIVAADNVKLDYKNNGDIDFNNKLNGIEKQTFSSSLLGILDSDNPETGVDDDNFTATTVTVDDVLDNENAINGSDNIISDIEDVEYPDFPNSSVVSSPAGYFTSNTTSNKGKDNDVEENKFYYQDLKIYDSDGNEIGVVQEGKYDIYEIEYDAEGNIIKIRISPNGEKEKWIKIDDLLLENSTVIKFEQIGVYHYDDLAQLMIYDSKGNVIGILKKGDYSVYDVKYDENGNVVAIRISDADESEKWVYIYQDGEYIGKYYELTKQGIFIYEDMEVIISDKYGNKIGILEKGSYKIYEFKYDEDGNVIAIRISKDSENEKWIFLKDNNLDILLVSPDIKIVKEVELDENGSKINFFNGKTIAGIIGVLVIAVGTVLYKKYKKNNHKEVVEPGEYNIYDTYLENDEISEVKASKPGDEEAWIELE